MALADLLAKLERRADTPDTPCNPDGVSAKPAPLLGCTLDTPETPEIINAGSDALSGARVPSPSGLWYFVRPADVPMPHCDTCENSRKPGASRYCCARPDLPPAYGEGHPLRKLPDDDGADCEQWVSRIGGT
jgi:hypothetical protein